MKVDNRGILYIIEINDRKYNVAVCKTCNSVAFVDIDAKISDITLEKELSLCCNKPNYSYLRTFNDNLFVITDTRGYKVEYFSSHYAPCGIYKVL